MKDVKNMTLKEISKLVQEEWCDSRNDRSCIVIVAEKDGEDGLDNNIAVYGKGSQVAISLGSFLDDYKDLVTAAMLLNIARGSINEDTGSKDQESSPKQSDVRYN